MKRFVVRILLPRDERKSILFNTCLAEDDQEKEEGSSED